MYLRKLKEKDSAGMLEWMSDENICGCFQTDFSHMDEADCKRFILRAAEDDRQVHFAICNETDEYLGTISLKNIDRKNQNAEYAIVLRAEAIGKGVALEATQRILKYAFDELELHKVYLNVLSDNIRANKFYNKAGFSFEGEFKEYLCLQGSFKNLKWYGMVKEDFNNKNIRKVYSDVTQ